MNDRTLTNRPLTSLFFPQSGHVVKVANMMKVLTASAVQDPTKVEARVKAEAAARVRKHEQTNAERALTDEQKRERLEQKKVKEEGKGVYGCAFKYVGLHIWDQIRLVSAHACNCITESSTSSTEHTNSRSERRRNSSLSMECSFSTQTLPSSTSRVRPLR